MSMTKQTAVEYCETLLRHFIDQLSEWEEDRVREWQAKLAKGYVLTDRQGEILDEIMERCARQHGR